MSKWRWLLIMILTCAQGLQAQGILQEFFQGKDKIIIPFEFQGHFIVVDVIFEGYLPLKFIVDTGSEHTLIFDKTLVELFNIDFSRKIKIIGSDYTQDIDAYVARGVHLKVHKAPTRTKDVIVLQSDIFGLSKITGIQVDGILGGTFFKNSVLEIDYKKQRLIMYDANKFLTKKLNGYKSYPIDMERNKPYLNATCKLQNQQDQDIKVLLDTGAGLALLLYADERNNIIIPENNIPGFLGYGLGGRLLGYLGRVDRLDFGSFQFDQLAVNFQLLSDSLSVVTDNRDGIIGNQILERFNVVIDYVHSQLHLKPKKKWKRKFSLDRSGISVIAFGPHLDKYVIQSIIFESPAHDANFHTGDIIKSINRVPAYFFGLHGINKRLHREAGTELRIKVIREGKAKIIHLTLQDLI